jgi:NADH:ubiquinone oxidoreductase subunit 5 (subunit L)/multisubunit Na+/H+ antiporter MnhA subunit
MAPDHLLRIHDPLALVAQPPSIGILVLIYSDDYMSHNEGYLRFFVYISVFNTSMLGLVTSSNLIQIYFFGKLSECVPIY